jgi:hypothetical protein
LISATRNTFHDVLCGHGIQFVQAQDGSCAVAFGDNSADGHKGCLGFFGARSMGLSATAGFSSEEYRA